MPNKKALLIGVELKDLGFAERSRFQEYDVIVRPYILPEKLADYVERVRPEMVIVRQPSGKIYEYTANGQIRRQLAPVDPRINKLAEQQSEIIMPPKRIKSVGSSASPRRYGTPGPAYQRASYMTPAAAVYRPFPGAHIPSSLYPGESKYSYISGEGDQFPEEAPSVARQLLREAVPLGQRNFHPFWFDNFLNTNAAVQNEFASSTGVNDLPSLQLNADTTSNAAVVSGQLVGTGIGIGATLLESYLRKLEIESQEKSARRNALGTAYYEYPEHPYSVYPPLPYQPLPNEAGYYNQYSSSQPTQGRALPRRYPGGYGTESNYTDGYYY